MPNKTYSLAFLGFGNVGHHLARLLQSKTDELRDRYGIEWRLTGVATRRLGWLAAARGMDVSAVLGGRAESVARAEGAMGAWLSAARPDVVFEMTSLNPQTGQPAIDYIRAALQSGAHVVTANKGPVVHAYRELTDLAATLGKRFMFEATVMGGAPVFSLFREALPASNLLGFRALLNSTSNLILTEMEKATTFGPP